MRSIRWMALAAAALALVAGACGQAAEKVAESAGDKLAERVAEEAGKAGGAAENLDIASGELPSGWPKQFPTPAGAKPVYSTAADDTMIVYFSNPDNVDLKGFFDAELSRNGWQSEKQEFSGGGFSFVSFEITGHGFEGTVSLGKSPGFSDFSGEFAFFAQLKKG